MWIFEVNQGEPLERAKTICPPFVGSYAHHCDPGELSMNVTTALPVRKCGNERACAPAEINRYQGKK